MFASLIQQTKKIIQEKYLKHDDGNTTVGDEAEATDEQLHERSLEMKYQIFGQYPRPFSFNTVFFV